MAQAYRCADPEIWSWKLNFGVCFQFERFILTYNKPIHLNQVAWWWYLVTDDSI